MNLRIIILLLLVIVSTGASVWLYLQSGNNEVMAFEGHKLELELENAAKDFQRIKIENHQGVLFSAVKDTDRWIATHLDTVMTFPVDTKKLARLVIDLSQTRVVELKTSQPDFYHRLGVESVRDEDAQSVLIETGGANDASSLLVGRQAAGGRGTYVRQPESQTSVLVDKNYRLPENRSSWLTRDILPFTSTAIRDIVIALNGAPLLNLDRHGESVDGWQISDLAPTETLRYPTVIGQAVDKMLAFNFEAVSPYVPAQWEQQAQLSQLVFTLEDGTEVMAYIASAKQAGYELRFEVPGAKPWFTEWKFVLTESQARPFLLSRDMMVQG